MTDELFPVPASVAQAAHVDRAAYDEMYRRSVEDPEGFWGEHGKRIDWFKPYTKVQDVSYAKDDLHVRWYYDGTTNAAYNCLDRHLEKRGDQTAIIWEGDDPSLDKHISYTSVRAGLQVGQRLQIDGRRQRRPRHPLHADDPGSGLRDAGLRPDRRDPFHRFRRLLAGGIGRPRIWTAMRP